MHCMNVACDPQQGGSLTETNTKEEKEGELICKDGQICSNKLITERSERGTTQCVVVHIFETIKDNKKIEDGGVCLTSHNENFEFQKIDLSLLKTQW